MPFRKAIRTLFFEGCSALYPLGASAMPIVLLSRVGTDSFESCWAVNFGMSGSNAWPREAATGVGTARHESIRSVDPCFENR